MPARQPLSTQGSGLRIALAASVAAVAVLVLGLFSARALIHAKALQKQLDHAQAIALVQQRLVESLGSAGASGLQAAVAEVLTERWGFTSLSVRRGDGRILASGTAAERALPLLASLPWRKRSSSDSGRLLLKNAVEPQATLEYALGNSQARLVHDAALDRLRQFGAIGSVLALMFAAALVVLVRQSLRLSAQAELLREGGPLRETSPGKSPARTSTGGSDLPAQLAETLDGFDHGLILISHDLQVRQLNRTAARLTGWNERDAVGQLIYTVFHAREESGAPITSPAERCVRENIDIAAEELWLKPRGESQPDRILEATATSQLLADGERGALMLFTDIRSRVAGREELRGKARLVETVLDQLGEGVLTTDAAGVVRGANLRVQRMFGYSHDELLKMTVARLLPVPFMNTPGVKLADYANPGSVRLPKVAGWRKDATTFPAEISVKPIQAGAESRMVVVVSDISERQRSSSLAQRLGRLLDHASEEVYIFDAQSLYFLEVNAGARHNLGLTAEELGRMSLVTIATGLESSLLEGYLTKLRGGEAEHYTYHARHRRVDGTSYPVEVRLSFSREEEPPVFMAIAQDITEREASEKRMRQLAHYDMLTGLPNRALLFDRLKQAMAATVRAKRTLAVFFLDLNGFKPINDNYGHEAGDEVLKLVAERLSAGLRAGDTVARLGGDEFVVLAQGLNDVSDVTSLAWKLIELFDLPFEVKLKPLRISTSLGITLYPQDNSEPEGLLRHADAAMYESKQAGPGRFHFYEAVQEPITSKRSKSRRNLAREIQAALASGQFQCQFWPAFTSDDQTLAGGIADFHWSHPSYGRVESGETLYAARRSGLNVELEQWLLRQVVKQRAHAEQLGIPLVPVVVNITGRQWRDPDFADALAALLQEHNAPAQGLLLGISSEDWIDAAGAVQMLWPRLLEAGVRIAVREPDLAGPLESAGMILLGPATAERVLEDSKTVERVRAYVATGLPVLAEGVASRQQRERLQVLGCTHVSGPLCGGPYTPSEFASWFGVRKVRAV